MATHCGKIATKKKKKAHCAHIKQYFIDIAKMIIIRAIYFVQWAIVSCNTMGYIHFGKGSSYELLSSQRSAQSD